MLLKTKHYNNMFGGYTTKFFDRSEDSTYTCREDKDCFIFNLNFEKKFDLNHNFNSYKCAIFDVESYFPCFGAEIYSDLTINNCDIIKI
jgi:hypothetical protein